MDGSANSSFNSTETSVCRDSLGLVRTIQAKGPLGYMRLIQQKKNWPKSPKETEKKKEKKKKNMQNMGAEL